MRTSPLPPFVARLLSFALLLVPLAPLPAFSAEGPSGRTLDPRIVNGLETHDYPAVVALVQSQSFLSCSATLVGCSTVLTAAHCVCNDSEQDSVPGCQNPSLPSSLDVFVPSAGFFDVASVAMPLDYVFGVGGDVAVLTLTEPVTGVAPAPINTSADPANGLSGTLVGFGLTSGFQSDAGIKRKGDIVTESCTTVPDDRHLCWSFDPPVGPAGDDSNTCSGDSGGPLFLDLGDGPLLAGVTSGGESSFCTAPDDSFDSNVFVERGFIAAAAGADLGGPHCGNLSAAGNQGGEILGGAGLLDGSPGEGNHSWDVPLDTVTMRVALNGDDDMDANLYVRLASPPSTTVFDCASEISGPFEFCEIPDPTPGTWHLLADLTSGSGRYQATVTLFSSSIIFSDGVESGNVSAWSAATP